MRLIKYYLIFLIISSNVLSREIGETEITTDEGIEVYQNEKYYLLKKNVKIVSDNFSLNADLIKIYYDKNLYDISKIEAEKNVTLTSSEYNINSKGESLKFNLMNEEIFIEGLNSELITNDINMFSNGYIRVNNKDGNFNLKGKGSTLSNDTFIIKGSDITGIFETINTKKEINLLNVLDDKLSYFKNNNIEMFANKIKYDSNISLIELEKNVKIIREGETIIGDYGSLDTKNNSYNIKSNDSKKVKIIISNNNE